MDIGNFVTEAQTAAQALAESSAEQPLVLGAIVLCVSGAVLFATVCINAARSAGRHNREAETHLRAIQALAMEIRQLSSQQAKTVAGDNKEIRPATKARVESGPIRVGSLTTTPEAEVEIIPDGGLQSNDELLLSTGEERPDVNLRFAQNKHLQSNDAGAPAPKSTLKGKSFLRR